MAKAPVSVTLGSDNLIWLRGRVAARKQRSLSHAIDEILTAARLGAAAAEPGRTVVGTIAIAADDPGLDQADAYVRALVDASLATPLVVRESGEQVPQARGARRDGAARKKARGRA